MKVMITYPPLQNAKGFPLLSQNRQFQWYNNFTALYPIVSASAATLLRENDFEVVWKDAIVERMDENDFLSFFETQSPDLVAIETKTPIIKSHWHIINKLKKLNPETKFVLMGDHVTALPKESLDAYTSLNYVITGGDYDFSLLELAKNLEYGTDLPKGLWYREGDKIKNTGQFELSGDLNSLPFIDRKLTKFQLYEEFNIKYKPFAYVMAGRDCPYHKCTFCAWTTIYPGFRVRSTENFLDEIGILIEKYGIKEIFDDTGTFPSGRWLERFCEGMIERGYNEEISFSCNFRFDYLKEENAKLMKKAGFRLIKAGLESANQNTLDRINKGIKVEDIKYGCEIAKKVGLDVHLAMIVGYPWETKKEAFNTLKLAKKLMTSGAAEVLQATVLIPYPGTALHQQALENDWFRIDPKDYDRYDMTETVLKTQDMTPKEVMEICDRIYKDIFLSPEYIIRHLANIRSLYDVKYILRGLKAVIGHVKDFKREVNNE